jgi:hypothetical protein
MYAAAAQNHSQEEDSVVVPRVIAPVCWPSSRLGAGATPADGTNRDSDPSDSPCCPPPSRGGFCSDSPAGERASASPSLFRWTRCESGALYKSLSPVGRDVWQRFYFYRSLVTRLECTDERNPWLAEAREQLAALTPMVDTLLDAEQARREAARQVCVCLPP